MLDISLKGSTSEVLRTIAVGRGDPEPYSTLVGYCLCVLIFHFGNAQVCEARRHAL